MTNPNPQQRPKACRHPKARRHPVAQALVFAMRDVGPADTLEAIADGIVMHLDVMGYDVVARGSRSTARRKT